MNNQHKKDHKIKLDEQFKQQDEMGWYVGMCIIESAKCKEK